MNSKIILPGLLVGLVNFLASMLVSKIFGVNLSAINSIGDDDLRDVKTFKRTAKADLEIKLNKKEKNI